jgi:hypothetical protein
MKLRYFVLVTLAAALTAACADTPTASKPGTRTPGRQMVTETDTTTRNGGTYGSGH